MSKIYLGMQCFWGAEALFGSKTGIIATRVGYTGGSTKNPTYRNLNDHIEAVAIDFDPNYIKYEDILKLFFNSHNPTLKIAKRQYISAVFYENETQKDIILKTIETLSKNYSKPILTEIIPFTIFTNAENYHQKYFLRKHNEILNELDLNDEKLITSPIACRLNGFCAGFGTIEQLQEFINFKISSKNIETLQNLIKKGPNLIECSI